MSEIEQIFVVSINIEHLLSIFKFQLVLDLCGLEVAADYPHVEIGGASAGVNHFPEGVFQKCRTIINKEKAEERERLRKLKRSKKNSTKSGSYSANFVLPTEWDTDTASLPSITRGGNENQNIELIGVNRADVAAVYLLRDNEELIQPRYDDNFDEPWEQAIRTHPASPVRTTRRVMNPRR